MRLLVVILVLGLIVLSGVALAADQGDDKNGTATADLARPHAIRIVNRVGRSTGWDCQYLIGETAGVFTVVVWCDK